MYISHKSNIVQSVTGEEWRCRMKSKGMAGDEYWAWIDGITTQDADGKDIITYPSEDFTIVECTNAEEDIQERLRDLKSYIDEETSTYNIKWSDEKVDGSHLAGNDSAKDARLLVEEWELIREERTRLLAETDWMAMSDNTVSAAWKTYRQELRDLPDDQSSKTSFDDIVWPSKPS